MWCWHQGSQQGCLPGSSHAPIYVVLLPWSKTPMPGTVLRSDMLDTDKPKGGLLCLHSIADLYQDVTLYPSH